MDTAAMNLQHRKDWEAKGEWGKTSWQSWGWFSFLGKNPPDKDLSENEGMHSIIALVYSPALRLETEGKDLSSGLTWSLV